LFAEKPEFAQPVKGLDDFVVGWIIRMILQKLKSQTDFEVSKGSLKPQIQGRGVLTFLLDMCS
jgi:hypothetical protein